MNNERMLLQRPLGLIVAKFTRQNGCRGLREAVLLSGALLKRSTVCPKPRICSGDSITAGFLYEHYRVALAPVRHDSATCIIASVLLSPAT
jgi:hypothetical protein